MRSLQAALAVLVLLMPSISAAQGQVCPDWAPHWQPSALTPVTQARYLAADGRIRIVGYNDMAEMLGALAKLFTMAHPEFRFELILRGTRTGPPALITGETLFAPMGAEFTAADLAAYRKIHDNEPLVVKVAHASLKPGAITSPLGIYVHRDNPVKAISMKMLRNIFTGRDRKPVITRWGQIGGKSEWKTRSVRPVGMGRSTALGLFMRDHKWRGKEYTTNVVEMRQSREVVSYIARTPEAIGFANLSNASDQVRLVPLVDDSSGEMFAGTEAEVRSGRYPLDRHLLIYLSLTDNGALDPVAREWLALALSCEGQSVIASGTLGYLPLNATEFGIIESKILKI